MLLAVSALIKDNIVRQLPCLLTFSEVCIVAVETPRIASVSPALHRTLLALIISRIFCGQMFAARLNFSRQALSTRWWNSKNLFSTTLARPTRRSNVSAEERASLRAARKERASRVLEQQQATKQGETTASTRSATTYTTKAPNIIMSRYFWYLSVGVPSAVLIWGFSDENSPPAQFSRMIGLTDLVIRYTEDIAKPSHAKLLPDWSQV